MYNPIIVNPVIKMRPLPVAYPHQPIITKYPPPLTSSSLKLLIKNINFFQALVSHDSKLPDDVITPVLPPILPSPSFPLPRMQRVQRGGSLENPSTSQGAVSTPIHFYKMIYCGNFKKPSRSG